MSRQCMITGKKQMSGNNVSHAKNRTKRTFLPNVQDTSVYSETLNKKVKLRISAAGLRTLDHKGGIDAYLTSTAPTKVDPALRATKKLIEKVQAAKAAAA